MQSLASRWPLTLAAALAAAGCGDERLRRGEDSCVSWFPDVQPVVAVACAPCHGGPAPAGDYDMSTYRQVIGSGSDDQPNARAGDASSLVITTLVSASGPPHRDFDDVAALLTEWVATCELSHRRSRAHPGGILNPLDDDFHGAAVAAARYDIAVCTPCHGTDFAGGSSGTSCLDCHPDGPDDCTTCHGDLAQSGAHRAHVGTRFDRSRCAACHLVPDALLSHGHVLDATGALDPPPAEVTIEAALAAATPPGTERAGPPAYDPTTGRCENVFCHGAVFDDPAATTPAPAWTDVGIADRCNSCHGDPPADHADDRCSVCHGAVIDAMRVFTAPARHIDGAVDVGDDGDGGSACDGCHGGRDAGPPPDLAGIRSTAVVTVGAHRAHVEARSRLRGPIPCGDCHPEPDAVRSPGHIDSGPPAEVFPGGGLAFADGARPSWSRTTATCAGVYCHGGGEGLAGDAAPGLNREPVWTAVGIGQDACGTCHGVPPTTVPHNDAMTVTDCATCHPSVDGFGNPIVTGPANAPTSLHINGVADVR